VSRGLLLAAHGSRDATATAATERIVALVRAELPGVDVAIGYLEHAEPALPDALARLLADNDTVTVVPLLFAPGRHNDIDLPALVNRPGVTVTPPLGADPLVAAALRDRLVDADIAGDAAVVVVSAGSKDPSAFSTVEATARLLTEASGWRTFATEASADIAAVVAAARAAGAASVAVSPLLLAPGTFADRVTASAYDAGADTVASPIADHPAIAVLVAKRYTATTEVAA
jgi:sirohydrochlorin ferrochelatase